MAKESVKVFQGKNYHEESFSLDDCVFIDCVLKNCDLFYAGGDFELVNTNLDNCRVHFRGAAKNTVGIMQMLRMVPGPIQLPPQTQSPKQPN